MLKIPIALPLIRLFNKIPYSTIGMSKLLSGYCKLFNKQLTGTLCNMSAVGVINGQSFSVLMDVRNAIVCGPHPILFVRLRVLRQGRTNTVQCPHIN